MHHPKAWELTATVIICSVLESEIESGFRGDTHLGSGRVDGGAQLRREEPRSKWLTHLEG